MNFEKFRTETAEVSISKFEGKLSEEYNLFITPSISESVEEQLNAIRNALTTFLDKENCTSEHIAFQRLFVSDFTNQSVELDKTDLFNCDCALSIVQQSPLNGKKVGLWTCLYKDKTSNSFHKKRKEINWLLTIMAIRIYTLHKCTAPMPKLVHTTRPITY